MRTPCKGVPRIGFFDKIITLFCAIKTIHIDFQRKNNNNEKNTHTDIAVHFDSDRINPLQFFFSVDVGLIIFGTVLCRLCNIKR